MNCGICGNGYRSKATLVYVAEGGSLVRKRACPTCVGRGITVVPSEAAGRCKCGDVATTCGLCVSKKELAARKGGADATKLAKQLDNLASAYKAKAATDEVGRTVDQFICRASRAGIEEQEPNLRNQPSMTAEPEGYTDGYVAGMEAAATYLRSGRY